MFSQVGSVSTAGLVAVIQSTIFRSPVVVVMRAGLSSVIPVSRKPIVTPRPSHVGWAARNCAAPVSWVGMYGFAFGVLALGGVCGRTAVPSGLGSPSGMTSFTSRDLTV